ncbi:hypothetical protein [Legionella maceachernii]|uniref:Interaptin n=1 Tax=Legionella maceachernii TaxID=466 RepID=A0A0W0VUM4_9GAMM|nr:hypothetical protein [Legionella maceachernii]KTD23911.1 interaptin [Legionella maceachernii]SKA17804.1 hypothetical protein SAMN02745128_02410 [Legionella maceachernii]SUP04556.1 Uncharacterised protein [Legionella maceachernii]
MRKNHRLYLEFFDHGSDEDYSSEELKRIEERKQQIYRLLSDRSLFPQTASARVKFAMGVANLLLGYFGLPSKTYPIQVNTKGPAGFARYLWTALMVFGKHHPDGAFGHEAIVISGSSERYPEEELGGFWSTFSAKSLYETVFKHYLTQEMLVLTENPELFEGVSSEQYKTVDEQITAGKEKIAKELDKEKEKQQHIETLLNNPLLFPKTPSARVKFAMAIANLYLVNKEPPSEEHPIVIEIRNTGETSKIVRYLWTAFMVFGKNHPHAPFNHKAIVVHDCTFSEDKELGGFWSTFSKVSLYETEFKHHLHPSMLVLSENPELFEGISNEVYRTIAEQIRAKEEGPFKSLAQMQAEASTHEVPQNKGLTQASKMQKALCDKPSSAKTSSSTPSIPSSASDKETEQSALELAQLTEENKPGDFKQVFSSYLHAARSGHSEALVSLERLAQEANKDQQLALSQLYGSFFHNDEKAAYWRQKATEIAQPSFDIQFN